MAADRAAQADLDHHGRADLRAAERELTGAMSLFVLSLGFGLVTASVLSIAALGFTLQFGISNVLNLAYSSFMTLAGFIAYWLNSHGLDIWLCLIVAAAVTALLSLGLARGVYEPFIRRGARSFEILIISLAVGVALTNLLLAFIGPSGYSYPGVQKATVYHFAGLTLSSAQILVIGIAVVLMIGCHLLLTTTTLGRALRATAENAELARACGIATPRIIRLVWLLSGALCGTAGVVLFLSISSFTVQSGQDFLIPIVAAAVLGGIGQPYGAMLGALVIGLASEVSAAFINPADKEVVAFALLVLVLLIRPQGILAEAARQREVIT
jgi:branched-subunit amino acid ABC-type transport system permease component